MRRKLLITSAACVAIAAGGAFYISTAQASCTTPDCFVEAIRECRAESYVPDAPEGFGAAGEYTVTGPEQGACGVEFAFSDNPDPDLVGKPLRFLVERAEASEETVLAAVESCMSGGGGAYRCSGPLFERMAAARGQAGSLADAEGPFPCGAGPVPAAGPPLYPLPADGKWGYVDRAGEWRIAPQWDRAEDFHEGRAAVGSPFAWGIIDREGNYVLDLQHEGDSSTEIGGQRWISSPFAPYSEGCTVANLFTDSPQPPFFVDRDGRAHWRTDPPASIADRDIRQFGGFSEGLAWFRVGSGADARYGWIDPAGAVAIEAEFFDAGDFSGGLAPASSREGQAGFISPDGRLQLPRKWTLDGAEAFSDGLALVHTGPFDRAFMDRDGFAFERVSVEADGGKALELEIEAAGAFRDGLAPVIIDGGDGRKLVYVTARGGVAFVPDEIEGIAVCDARGLPEFRDGLVRLLVADDGQTCGEGHFLSGLASYEKARYVYLDTAGNVALRQEK